MRDNINAPKISGGNFRDNRGNINFGQQSITDNAVKYSVPVRNVADDTESLESLYNSIIKKLGEKKSNNIALASIIIGAIDIVLNLIVMLWDLKSIIVLSFFSEHGQWFILLGALLIIFGGFLLHLIHSKDELRCKKCKKSFALEPKSAEIYEKPVKGGIMATIFTHYKCKYCGELETKKTKEKFIRDEEINSWRKQYTK